MEDSPMYAADIRALTMRADSADWTAEALAVENRVLLGAINALTARAEKAEARVKEQQSELAEAEREKLVAFEAVRKGRNTTTGTGLPGFTMPQAKGVAYWEPAAPEGKEVSNG